VPKQQLVAEKQQEITWDVDEWHGRMLIDGSGARLGKLQDVYIDVESDKPEFATIKEGTFHRHLTFVPLAGLRVEPDHLHVSVSKAQIKSAPSIAARGQELSNDQESVLYHHYGFNYVAPDTVRGRRLARR
jgi:hypothetical protein